MVRARTWFCYMLRCRDGSFYVGVASDLAARVQRHNAGLGVRFTARRRPVELIWWQEFPDQKDARGREAELKGWRREKKLKLLVGFGDRNIPSAPKLAVEGEIGNVGKNPSAAKGAISGESSNG